MKKHGKKVPPIKRVAAGKSAAKKTSVAAIAPAPRPAEAVDAPPPSKKAVPGVKASDTAPRVKLVRDSFTMPREDFELVAQLKARALEFKRPTKKSELLRAGLQGLAALSTAQLQDALASLRALPSGRPKKKR